MANDQYLIVSYGLAGALSCAFGVSVYFYLRRPFAAVADLASAGHYSSFLKKLFPFGLVFPAFLGFVSVSYWGCGLTSYAAVVRSREYLVQKNQEQLSSVLFFICVAILFWDAVAILILKYRYVPHARSQIPTAGQ